MSTDFVLGNLKQLRWFRAEKKGFVGVVVKALYGLPKDYSSWLPISRNVTVEYT